jgi:hypothetical protein
VGHRTQAHRLTWGSALTFRRYSATMDGNTSPNFSQGSQMRARFLGKDPNSQVDNSPTLFATDRTDPGPTSPRAGR